ncbi:MAG: SDR family NAD(P)-dependent oxidoreductase [Archangium sp.]
MKPTELRAVITGATAGLGQGLAARLAAAGAQVEFTARDAARGAAAAQALGPKCSAITCDLSSMASVRAAAQQLARGEKPIDLLVLNAGVSGKPFQLTAEGFEYTFASNYLGHFLLVRLLLDAKALSSDARIIVTQSTAVRRSVKADLAMATAPTPTGFSRFGAGPSTKVLLQLMTLELTRRGTTIFGVDPGGTRTSNVNEIPALLRPVLKLLLQPLEAGVEHLVWGATTEGLERGAVYDAKHQRVKLSPHASDAELASRAWGETERVLSKWLAPTT